MGVAVVDRRLRVLVEVELFLPDEVNAAAQRVGVDRAAELDADAGLQGEAVERIDEAEFGAGGGLDRAVGQRHGDARAGLLVRVGDGQEVRGERADLVVCGIEGDDDAARPDQGGGEEA